MKIIYFLRVFFISFEFLLIFFSFYFYNYAYDFFSAIEIDIRKNENFFNWICLLPMTIGVFNIRSVKTSNFLKIDENFQIINWKFFWKLKIHLIVSVIYSVLFIMISVIPIIISGDMSDFLFFYIFLTGLVGQCILYLSIHLSEDKIFEILKSSQ